MGSPVGLLPGMVRRGVGKERAIENYFIRYDVSNAFN